MDKTGEEATQGHGLSSLGLTCGSSVASTALPSLPIETRGLALCTSYHAVVSCRLPWSEWGVTSRDKEILPVEVCSLDKGGICELFAVNSQGSWGMGAWAWQRASGQCTTASPTTEPK